MNQLVDHIRRLAKAGAGFFAAQSVPAIILLFFTPEQWAWIAFFLAAALSLTAIIFYKKTKIVPFVQIREISNRLGKATYIAGNGGGRPNFAYAIEQEIQSRAQRGEIAIYGALLSTKDRTFPTGYGPIPRDHFDTHGIAHGTLHYKTKNTNTYTADSILKTINESKTGYFNLHLEQSAAESAVKYVLKRAKKRLIDGYYPDAL